MRVKNILLTTGIACLLAAGLAPAAGASTPFASYRYDYWDTALPMPTGYDAVTAYSAEHMGVAALHDSSLGLPSDLSAPSDLFYAPDGFFYIVDKGNNRIVKLDKSLKCVRDYTSFTGKDGQPVTLLEPTGIFVEDSGAMYIADGGNQRVLVCDGEGRVTGEITQPKTDVYPSDVPFKASKVLRDNQGVTYVVVEGLFYGAATFDANNQFTGFFGSNRVQLSASQLADTLWRKLFPRDKNEFQSRYVPVEFSNLDIDQDGFIYSCTKTMNISEKIKKLNAMSINIMPEKAFGDKEIIWGRMGDITDTQFVDLAIDDNNFINALDFTRGRIFQYDPEGQLMFVFGGIGAQLGLFSEPAAIETVDGRVYVLDSKKCSVTVFEPNALGGSTHEAIRLYNKGLYDEAIEPWRRVLRSDGSSTFAYASLGKAYFDAGEYKQAMDSFHLGQDREGYSQAFKEYRTGLIRQNFLLIGVAAILLILIAVYAFKRRKWAPALAKIGIRVKPKRPTSEIRGFRYIGYVLRHPIEGYEEMKYKKGGRLSIAVLIVLLWFVLAVIRYDAVGFIFNYNKPHQINVGIIFLSTIFLFLLWVIANWCLCTLFNGEGKMRQIFIHSAYALVPYLGSLILSTILSNVLSMDEGAFITWVSVFGLLWTGLLLFCGMMTLHNYSGGKTILSILVTIIGMLAITFLLVLAFTLVQQMVSFVVTIVKELNFRQY